MTPERWQRIKQVFESALECETGQRAVFLDQACAGDDELRAEVEALIRGHEQANSFIEAPAAKQAAELFTGKPSSSAPGRRVGPYKLLREIGHGGMGEVFLAVRADDQYQKRVAIKLVRPGLNNEDILRRFRHERQILASLDHHNIARLLDGGTTEEGLPYFAMEYIEGLPITDYCDRHKLSTVGRLKLFRKVCAAVQHAHQNLVIHRDIKPSNILITDEGEPKLLDFGIAKILNPEEFGVTVDQTQAGLRLMTPEYASPEQVRGEKITTASDVYSLGVLLYELLTGRRPYNVNSRAPHEVMRIICEEEPAKPSTAVGRVETMSSPDGATRPLTPDSPNRVNDGQLAKLRRNLRGDLDNIALMALRKEPERRYTTVNQLSEDIRRHLEGLPVIARKDTLGYRSAKFIRRNRVAVLAATAFLILIVISLVGLSAQAARIARERDRAVAAEKRAAEQLEQAERAREAERQQRHLAEENLRRAMEAEQKATVESKRAGAEAARANSEAAVAKEERARAERRFNDVRKLANFALFDLHDAIEQLPGATPVREMLVTKGLEYLDSLAKEATNDRSLRQELGTAYRKVGDVQGRPLYANLGYSAEAMKNYRRSLEELEPLAATDPDDAPVQLALALSYDRVGDGLIQMGYATRSLEAYRKELAIAERLSQTLPNDPQVRRALARAYLKVGDSTGTPVLANLGQLGKALEYQHRALNIRERLAAENPNNIEERLDLAISYGRVGIILVNSGQTAQGLEIIRKGVKIDEDALKGHPDHAMTRRELVVYYGLLGNVLAMVGDLTGAMENYRSSLDLGEGLLKSDPRNANLRNDVAQTYTALGNALAVTGDSPNGLENIRKGLSISEDLVAKDPSNMIFRAVLSSNYSSLSGFFTSTGNSPAAQNHIRKALDASETISAVDPQNIQARLDIWNIQNWQGGILLSAGNAQAGLESSRKGMSIGESLQTVDAQNVSIRNLLATSYTNIAFAMSAANKFSDAREYFLKALTICEELSAKDPVNTGVRNSLAINYRLFGNLLIGNNDLPGGMDYLQKATATWKVLSEITPRNEQYPQNLVSVHFDQAFALDAQGKQAEAKSLYRETISIARKAFGPDHLYVANLLSSLGNIFFRKGEYSESEAAYREALAINLKHLDKADLNVAQVQVNLANVLIRKGAAKEAEPMIREGLEIRRKKLPKGNWQVASAESILGACLTALQRFEEAEPLLINSYPALKSQLGERDIRAQDALGRIIKLYEDWGKPDKATQFRSLLPKPAETQTKPRE